MPRTTRKAFGFIFQDKVNQLHSMFSNLTTDVIASVLESKGGNMEQTVEALLSMNNSAAPRQPVWPVFAARCFAAFVRLIFLSAWRARCSS